MKKLSPEELKERRSKRLMERVEAHLKFPPATLGTYGRENGVSLEMEAGNGFLLIAKRRGEWRKMDDPGGEWYDIIIDLQAELPELARFLRALVCRYNAFIDDMNSMIADSQIKQAECVPDAKSNSAGDA